METLIHHFGLAAVIAVGLAAIAVGARRKLLLKAAAFALAALFIPVAYASMVGLLGAPKPLHLEWRHDGIEEATVLGASIREDQGIYLWLQFDGDPEPQSYKLPWNRDQASVTWPRCTAVLAWFLTIPRIGAAMSAGDRPAVAT